MLKAQWKSVIKGFNERCFVPEEEWEANTAANMHRFHASNSIWNLEGMCWPPTDKAVVVVGASPILKRDVKKLLGCNKEDFCVAVVNSALKMVLKAGVKPDYVIAIDSDEEDISQHLDVDSKDLSLITCNILNPNVLDAWKGPIWYFPYFAVSKKLKKKLRNRLGKAVPVGGNALTSMASISTSVFGARIVVLVGSECCYTKDYYPSKDIPRNNLPTLEFYVNDINGNRRVTTTPLHTYKLWMERFATHVHPLGVKVIDTSEGIMGKREDKSSIYTYELTEIISKIKEAANKKRELINANPLLLNAPLHPPGQRWQMHRRNRRTYVRDCDSACRTGSAGLPEMQPAQNCF